MTNQAEHTPSNDAEQLELASNTIEWSKVFEVLSDPVFCHDAEFRITLANKAFLTWIGKGREEVLGERYWEVCDFFQGPLKSCTEALDAHGHREERLSYGDGKDFLSRSLPIYDNSGDYLFSVHLLRDLSEQCALEMKLQHEYAVDRAVAELSPLLMVAECSIKEVAEMVLLQAQKLTGAKHGIVSAIDPETGENVGHTLTNMMDQCKVAAEQKKIRFPKGDDGLYPGLFGHALNSRQGFFCNDPDIHPQSIGVPEGHVRLENFLSVPAKVDGRLVGQIALANNDTGFEQWHLDAVDQLGRLYAIAIEYRQKVQQVSVAGQRLRDIIENQADGILVLGSEGNIRFVNRVAETMLGRSNKTLLGRDFGFPVSIGEGKATELQLIQADGELVIAEMRAAETEWDGGGAYVVSLHDITERIQHVQRVEAMLEDTIRAIAMAVEKRDPYTAGHQRRVAELVVALAHELGLGDDSIRGIYLGALIHDVGKIYTPSEVLSRPGKLSAAEFELIKSHTEIGYEIIKDVQFPWPIAKMVLQHHERLDGSGYPRGLSGDEVILETRILSVADVVEAINSHRPYRPALGMDVALREISMHRGSWYDPEVVDACLALLDQGRFHWKEL